MSIRNKKVLGIIPARSGSKGLKNKNIKYAGGIPLIGWTINAAKKSNYIDYIMTSTDSKKIAEISERYGSKAPYLRPKYLASDTANSIDVVLDVLKKIQGYDYFILLQPTSPLRTNFDIDAALELFDKSPAKTCVSVSKTLARPEWMYSLDSVNRMRPVIKKKKKVTRRQDLQDYFQVNGAIYIASVKWFKTNKTFYCSNTIAYVMPDSRSVDIDNNDDFSKFKKLAIKIK